MILQQITGHIKYGLYNFWYLAPEELGTEAIRELLHSVEHSQLIRMLSYQDGYWYTALHWCADNKNNEVIKVILDSVSEDECYQLLSISGTWRQTPLHRSCIRGDAESVRVMLNHINQDMRYSLLQITSNASNTPLHFASYNSHIDVIKVIHESVTQFQWINLLQMKGDEEMTVLQTAAYRSTQSSIDTIRDSVSGKEWIVLLSPLSEYKESIHSLEDFYQQAVSRIDELRAAARVKSVLRTENNSGMLSSNCHMCLVVTTARIKIKTEDVLKLLKLQVCISLVSRDQFWVCIPVVLERTTQKYQTLFFFDNIVQIFDLIGSTHQ